MTERSWMTPKRQSWFKATGVVLLVSLALYVLSAMVWPWKPGRTGGLIAGTIASLLFLSASLYPLRRRWSAWPWRSAQDWLQFHIYGSVVAGWLMFIHVGFALPHGTFGWSLWGLTLWTVFSGIGGVLIQKWVPAATTRSLRTEAIYDRIPELAARLLARADAMSRDVPDAVSEVYTVKLRALMLGVAPRWAYLSGPSAEFDRCVLPLKNLTPFLSEGEREKVADLEAVLREKLQLDAHYSFQRCLRGWLIFHVIPAILLMGLLAVHIGAAIVF